MSFPLSRLPVVHPLAVRAAHWIGRNWARIHYARRIEPTWLEINSHTLAVADLPPEFAGFKIAQMSDLHGGHHLPADFLPRAVDITLAQQADIIALTGDFIHKGYKHVDAVAKMLGRLQAPQGVFAVLGNHDFAVRNVLGFRRHRGLHQAVADALTANGIRVLRNESLYVHKGDGKICLAGVDDLWSGECDLDRALADLCPHTPRILLAHNPQTIHLLGDHRCDVVLSGHTHGGQINWPGLGRFFLGRKSREMAAGLYRQKSTHVYVNKGVGYGWRFRFGVRPEIAVFTLENVGQAGQPA